MHALHVPQHCLQDATVPMLQRAPVMVHSRLPRLLMLLTRCPGLRTPNSDHIKTEQSSGRLFETALIQASFGPSVVRHAHLKLKLRPTNRVIKACVLDVKTFSLSLGRRVFCIKPIFTSLFAVRS